VYTRDFNGNLILNAANGNLLGSFTAANFTALAPAVDQTTMFTLTNSPGTLTAQDVATGVSRWTFAGDGQLDSAPIILSTSAGEFVVEGSSAGMLYALNASTGAVVWSTSVGAAIPQPDEHNAVQLTGLTAGQGLLIVPAGNTISAFGAGPPPTPPSVPGGLKATAGNAQVSLSWSTSSGTAPISYSVYRGTASGKESATPIASGLTAASYVDTGLANGTTYYYEVRASNSAGTSGFSAEVSATPAAPPTVPGAPTGLTAASARGKGIGLSWTAPSNGGSAITSYTVYRGTAPGAELSYGSVHCSSSTCTFTDTNTKKGTLYVYQVAAVNAVGTGPRSNEASAKA
jgi:hypothetical protein